MSGIEITLTEDEWRRAAQVGCLGWREEWRYGDRPCFYVPVSTLRPDLDVLARRARGGNGA